VEAADARHDVLPDNRNKQECLNADIKNVKIHSKEEIEEPTSAFVGGRHLH